MITVDILQEDIDNGMRFSTLRCPIANAVKRITGEETIIAGPFYIAVYKETKRRFMAPHVEVKKYHVPPEARHFMRRFDSGQQVTPFSFSTYEYTYD